MSIRNRKFTLRLRPRSSLFLDGEGGGNDAKRAESELDLDSQSQSLSSTGKTITLMILALPSLGLGVLAFVFALSMFEALDSGKSNYIRKDISATATTSASASNKHYDAVIVGAGWAGISATKELLKDDVDNVLVLEAHDYIGGR